MYAPGNVNYCATKAYLTTFSEGLATELRGTGVQVQALCPGFTRSEFHHRMGEDARRRPGFTWLSAKAVVHASLAQLDRRGPVVCVPGLGYKLVVGLIRHLPRSLLGRLTAAGHRRL
jgi:short-subunit dehydrogenase